MQPLSYRECVPSAFWAALDVTKTSDELTESLISFHDAMLVRDSDTARDCEKDLLKSLGNLYNKMSIDCAKTLSPNVLFMTVAQYMAGAVLASEVGKCLCPEMLKELAVYFSLGGAKRFLQRAKCPPGFKCGNMFSMLQKIYKQIYPPDKGFVRKGVVYYPKLVMPDLSNGLGLSQDMKNQLQKGSMQWSTQYVGLWLNDRRPFDSRTEEWTSFLAFLLASPFREEAFVLYIEQQILRDTPDAIARDFFNMPITKETCLSVITNSEVNARCANRYAIAKFGPLNSALPFILETVMDPAEHLHEAQLPRGSYTYTLWLRFKDWHIKVETFRK